MQHIACYKDGFSVVPPYFKLFKTKSFFYRFKRLLINGDFRISTICRNPLVLKDDLDPTSFRRSKSKSLLRQSYLSNMIYSFIKVSNGVEGENRTHDLSFMSATL